MSDLLGVALVVPAAIASIVALLTAVTYLLPERVTRAQQSLEQTPGRSFVIGLVNLLFFGALAALLSQGGDLLKLISLLIMLSLLALAVVGLSGWLVTLRERIYAAENMGVSVLVATLRTALLLIIAFLAPFAGWFILAPIISIMGLGSGIVALVNRRALSDTAAESPGISESL